MSGEHDPPGLLTSSVGVRIAVGEIVSGEHDPPGLLTSSVGVRIAVGEIVSGEHEPPEQTLTEAEFWQDLEFIPERGPAQPGIRALHFLYPLGALRW